MGFLQIVDCYAGQHGIKPIRHSRQKWGDQRYPGDLDPNAVGGIVDVSHSVFVGITNGYCAPVAIGPSFFQVRDVGFVQTRTPYGLSKLARYDQPRLKAYRVSVCHQHRYLRVSENIIRNATKH